VKATPLRTLHKYFHYPSFRPGQIEIIRSIIGGQDTLAILPTGGGKSICFQIPGLIFTGTTIVISPLISLMKDQVDQLNQRGIKATFINSSLKLNEIQHRLNCLNLGQYQFCYVAPERLKTHSFLQICQHLTIPLLVIDEAHCISQWGHDFRPSYLAISQFIGQLSTRPVLAAFTATATKRVCQDITTSLQLIKPQLFSQGFYRHNLHFSVITCASNYQKEIWLFRLLKKHAGQSGIIYTTTRDSADYLAQLLKHFHLTAVSYHAGLAQSQRTLIQDQFLKNEVRVIVATNAFGMGIDKPDVRFVIHYQIPSSLENYYQEAGRAGRDKLQAACYLLFCARDISIVQNLIQSVSEEQRQVKLAQLQTMVKYALNKTCRLQYVIQYFGDDPSTLICKQCDNCTQPLKINDQETNRLSQLQLLVAQSDYQPSTNQLQQLVLHQPQSLHDLLLLPGWGRGLVERWGEQLLTA